MTTLKFGRIALRDQGFGLDKRPVTGPVIFPRSSISINAAGLAFSKPIDRRHLLGAADGKTI